MQLQIICISVEPVLSEMEIADMLAMRPGGLYIFTTRNCCAGLEWRAHRMTAKLEKRLEALCKEHGLRLTGQRRTILQALEESDDHPDAEELHRRVSKLAPGISLATVYRTVNLLEKCGLIERHAFSDGRMRFEASGAEHHDHFIDMTTNEVIEFRCDEIERLQHLLAEQHGFEIVGHRLEIYVRPKSGS